MATATTVPTAPQNLPLNHRRVPRGRRKDSTPTLFPDVLVVLDPAGRPDAERGGEPAHPVGVLRRDDPGRGQRFGQSRGGVGWLPDGHGRHGEDAGLCSFHFGIKVAPFSPTHLTPLVRGPHTMWLDDGITG